jgi:Spx/MgsR family transcriptional regulator
MKTVIHGIRNCDTMKKARAWLEAHGVPHEFHDYKVSGIPAGKLASWVKQVGWDALLNRAGTTFRKLPDSARANLTEAKAVRLMLEQPSMIRRPVLERGGQLIVGFRPEEYAALAGSHALPAAHEPPA